MKSSLSRSSFVAGSAAFAATAGRAGAQAALTPIHIAGSVNDDVTPMLYAISSGLMKRAGIDVTLDKGTSGSAVSAGVIGGSYQIGKSSVAGLITAHAKGVPFVFVAAAGLYESSLPVTALMVRSDSTIKTGADLNGKTVAVSAIGDLYTLTVKGWVDHTAAIRRRSNSPRFRSAPYPPPSRPAASMRAAWKSPKSPRR
jgi:NitT/TauT family transport system substrate-binding protein